MVTFLLEFESKYKFKARLGLTRVASDLNQGRVRPMSGRAQTRSGRAQTRSGRGRTELLLYELSQQKLG